MDCDIRDFVQRRIHFFSVYEHALTTLVRSRLSPGDVFLDIGANVGYFSLLASHLVGSNGKVLAIEADPGIHAKLVQNINLNTNLHVRTRQVAVTESRCRVSMRLDDKRNLGSTVAHLNDEGDVQGLPLTEAAEEMLTTANFIKIDVEGAEAPILDALLEALPRMESRLTIAAELQNDQADYITSFARAGLSCHAIPNRYEIEHYLQRLFRMEDPSSDALEPITEFKAGHRDYIFSRGW